MDLHWQSFSQQILRTASKYGVYFADVTPLIQRSVSTEHLGKYLSHRFLKLTFRMLSFTGKLTLPDGNEKLASYFTTV